MLRVILMGIGVVALILFVAWVLRDPMYLMVDQDEPAMDLPSRQEGEQTRPRRGVTDPQQHSAPQ